MSKQDEIDQEMKELVERLRKEFHEYWLKNGEPHPSSNAYLALTRSFYYHQGFLAGIIGPRE